MRKRKGRNLFYSYMVSYVGVIVIAFSLMTCLFMWSMVENIKKEEIRILQSRLYSFANDLEEQIDTMRYTALSLASRSEFRHDRFSQNKYLEYEMLNDLKHYNGMTNISDFFFLKYQGEDNIFTSQGQTVSFEVYCQNYIGEEERQNIYSVVEETGMDRDVFYTLIKTGKDSTILVYPLEKYAVSSIGMDGVLCFEIKEKLLKERMRQMVGEFDGNLEVYYDNTLLLYQNEFHKQSKGLTLETISENGKIRIAFEPETEEFFEWNNVFLPRKIALGIGVILLLFVVAVLEAWKNYVPIRKLVRKYNIQSNSAKNNELEQIDSMISTMILKEEKDGKELQEQYRLLREQILYRIAMGEYSPILKSRMLMLNIHLNGAVFGKIICNVEDMDRVDGNGELTMAIEELADDGTHVCAFRSGESQFIILVSAEEEHQIAEVEEGLVALMEARGVRADVEFQGVCKELTQLNRLGERGKTDRSAVFEEGADDGEKEENSKNQSMTAVRAIKFIDENYTHYDLSLDMVARELHITAAYLCRLIKQQTGMNYKEYLTRMRMEEAKKLLQDKNANIAEVCEKTGYTNVSHFIKTFQKYEGTTPAKYRDVQ